MALLWKVIFSWKLMSLWWALELAVEPPQKS